MDLSNLNFLAILTGAVLAWAFGSFWYSPILFSKTWQTESGISDESLQNANMIKIFGGSFLLMLIMSFGMAILLRGHDTTEIDLKMGLLHGLYVGLMFVATSIGINLLYQRKSIRLFLIDAGYQVIMLMIMGAVIGAWT